MAPESKDKPQHFRTKPRPGRVLVVRYRVAGTSAPEAAAVTRDVGPGGAFITCAEPLPVGTELELRLQLPATRLHPGQTLTVLAEVRWHGHEHRSAGMGVAFRPLGAEEALALGEYFASLTGSEA
ncbi:PilZ domain-containing protein [Haliangium sp.]|uniref:PilZ domain-containing protein n=1 Tax=Haliangium sp. TaxID=2663208 RepID=UPI003D0AD7DD